MNIRAAKRPGTVIPGRLLLFRNRELSHQIAVSRHNGVDQNLNFGRQIIGFVQINLLLPAVEADKNLAAAQRKEPLVPFALLETGAVVE